FESTRTCSTGSESKAAAIRLESMHSCGRMSTPTSHEIIAGAVCPQIVAGRRVVDRTRRLGGELNLGATVAKPFNLRDERGRSDWGRRHAIGGRRRSRRHVWPPARHAEERSHGARRRARQPDQHHWYNRTTLSVVARTVGNPTALAETARWARAVRPFVQRLGAPCRR